MDHISSSMKNKTQDPIQFAYCSFQVYDRMQTAIPENGKIVFTVIFFIYLVFGSCVNFLVVYLIKKTGQTSNQSTFLIMVLSLNEGCEALFNNSVYIIFLWYFRQLNCIVGHVMKFTSHLFSYTSSLMICFIGFDRFMRVVFSNRYDTVFNRTRYRIVMATTACLVIAQTILNFVGPVMIGEGWGAILTAPINVTLFTFTIICYFVCIYHLKKYSATSRRLSTENKPLVNMAYAYLAVFFSFRLPLIAYLLTYSMILRYASSQTLGVITCFIFLFMNTNSLLNSVLFLYKNRQSRRFLINFFNPDGNKREEAARGNAVKKCPVVAGAPDDSHTKRTDSIKIHPAAADIEPSQETEKEKELTDADNSVEVLDVNNND